MFRKFTSQSLKTQDSSEEKAFFKLMGIENPEQFKLLMEMREHDKKEQDKLRILVTIFDVSIRAHDLLNSMEPAQIKYDEETKKYQLVGSLHEKPLIFKTSAWKYVITKANKILVDTHNRLSRGSCIDGLAKECSEIGVMELKLEKFFADEEVAKKTLKEDYERRYQIDHYDLLRFKCNDDSKFSLLNTEIL